MTLKINKKILIITTPSFKKEWKKEIKSISKKNKFVFIDDEKKQIIHNIKKAHAMIDCPRYVFKNENFNFFKHLEWIHAGGAGVEDFINNKFIKSKIIFTNGKIIQGPEVADHALGLILSFTRNLYPIYQNISLSKIDRPIEIRNKKILIIGLGGIGVNTAERLKAFGAKIDAISNDLIPLVSFIDKLYLSDNLNNIAKNYDIIICAAPLTKKTKYMLDYNFFKQMKKNSIFINVSRGKIVKTKDLLKNSIYKKFRGIGLDVTDPEPLNEDNILKKAPNIFITPHMAGPSDYNRLRGFELVKENILRYLKGDSLLNIVDKNKGY